MSGICIAVFIFVILSNVHTFVLSKTQNYHDICRNSSGHRIYLEFGENGSLGARNLVAYNNGSNIKQECSLEIVSCPSCIIYVNFGFFNLSQTCNNQNYSKIDECEYIEILEHPYEELSVRKLYGESKDNVNIKTQTKTIIIKLFYIYNNHHAFKAEYRSQRNRQFLSGTPVFNTENSTNVLSSPFFPSYYLNDLSTEYVITCSHSDSANCRIRVIFSDFQLAVSSIMEFFDWNGQRLDVVTGRYFRPPIIISNGPSLVIRFYANGGSALGFKATYSFMFDQDDYNQTEYITDCGGYVENVGGWITMMDMVKEGEKKFYCFWIIKPTKSYLHFKTHLYLKIANFSDMEANTELIVHQGSTSAGKVLEVLRYPNTEIYNLSPREHIQPIDIGYYVSFKGVFSIKSRLAIIYAAFSYKECFSGADYLCENHRCIPRQLTCDSFDHCGDNSDEPATCYGDSDPVPTDRRWYSHTPNYFFPKIDPYSDLKTATMIFIICSLGLIGLVSAMFVLLYRINTRTRHEQELQNHLQIITDLLEEEIVDNDSISDEPPIYEAPPDYDEVIKVNCESTATSNGHKPKRPKRRKKKSRISKSHCSYMKNTSEYQKDLGYSLTLQTDDESMSSLPSGYNNSLINSLSINEIKAKKRFKKNNPIIYLSDKAISTTVRDILKRKWHSQGELMHIKKDSETSDMNEQNTKQKVSMFSQLRSYENSVDLSLRETASDSELLNLATDDEQEYVNGVMGSCRSERITQYEKGLFDYFKRKTTCQCEGACGCASDYQNTSKYNHNMNKKVSKKKHLKFHSNNNNVTL